MDILSLPIVMLENIVSYLNHDEIAKNRLICKAFNEVCMRMLNHGFLLIERRHAAALKTVKAQLPRRESERRSVEPLRYHPMARHCDILSSIETRISMLNMTYSKFIDNGLCCFIPGKVIDEIRRVLTIVEETRTPPRTHEVLQELRDISSMAIEHFDEKISPAFRKKLQDGATVCVATPSRDDILTPMALKQELLHVRQRSLVNAKLSLYLASQYKNFYKRMLMYKKIAIRQRKTIRALSKKQADQDSAIAELKKRVEECDIKYSELTHTNQAAGGKAIAASSTVTSEANRHFATQIKLDLSVLPIGTSRRTKNLLPNIKPRKPRIKLPSLSEDVEPPPKKSKTEQPSPCGPPSLPPLPSLPSRAHDTMAKIRDFAREIRSLARTDPALSAASDHSVRISKRSFNITALEDEFNAYCCKKQKLD